MKKLVGIFLAALMLLSLGGCWTYAGTYFAGELARNVAENRNSVGTRPPPDKDWADKARVEPELQKKSDFVVCAFATKNGKWETRVKFQPYIKEAKKRKLTCDVE